MKQPQDPTIETIIVNVSPQIAYDLLLESNQWLTSIDDITTAFFDVDDVLHWRMIKENGEEKEFKAILKSYLPGELIEWRSDNLPYTDGKAILEAIDNDKTEITFVLEYGEDSFIERRPSCDNRLKTDLEAFKRYAETTRINEIATEDMVVG